MGCISDLLYMVRVKESICEIVTGKGENMKNGEILMKIHANDNFQDRIYLSVTALYIQGRMLQ